MTLPEHYQAACALSPKAARLAARMLDRSTALPFAWRFSLRVALAERGRSAAALTDSDLAALTSLPRTKVGGRADRLPNAEQSEACAFFESVCRSIIREGQRKNRPTKETRP
ncbi:hypothetical protein J7E62_08205 [Variovorax paradoxus]|nr:hypothetical protein [Variovorax paradoxus]